MLESPPPPKIHSYTHHTPPTQVLYTLSSVCSFLTGLETCDGEEKVRFINWEKLEVTVGEERDNSSSTLIRLPALWVLEAGTLNPPVDASRVTLHLSSSCGNKIPETRWLK